MLEPKFETRLKASQGTSDQTGLDFTTAPSAMGLREFAPTRLGVNLHLLSLRPARKPALRKSRIEGLKPKPFEDPQARERDFFELTREVDLVKLQSTKI